MFLRIIFGYKQMYPIFDLRIVFDYIHPAKTGHTFLGGGFKYVLFLPPTWGK